MAHAITIRQSGFAEAAFARGTEAAGRWHGLGQDIDPNASIEQWQQAAGMDWKIQRSKVRYATAHGQDGAQYLAMDDQHVLFRSDSKAPLGVVSAKYQALQPRDALEFFRDLVAGNGFQLTSAGTLFGGRRYWALASIGEYASIIDAADRMEGYLLLSTSADGTLATSVRDTTVCVVCNNTLTAALSAATRHEVRITHRSKFDADKVKDQLGIARGNFAKFSTTMRELAKARLTTGDAQALTLKLLDPQLAAAAPTTPAAIVDHATAVDKVQESRQFKKVMALFNGAGMGSNLPGREGTFWGWVNAVTEYVDHHAQAQSDNNRLNSAWFGKGDDLKTSAVEIALATV